MATGIVAALALPVLGMLAGGGATQSLARDRETASRLAREIATSLAARPKVEDGFELAFPGGESVALAHPNGGGTITVHLAFDAEGRFLEPLSPEDFSSGIPVERSACHLARLDLKGVSSGDDRLLELELSVQQPAAAAEAVRSKERFQTRLGAL